MDVFQSSGDAPCMITTNAGGINIIKNECVLIWSSPIGFGVRPCGIPEVLNMSAPSK